MRLAAPSGGAIDVVPGETGAALRAVMGVFLDSTLVYEFRFYRQLF
jgi:hypothetical protein